VAKRQKYTALSGTGKLNIHLLSQACAFYSNESYASANSHRLWACANTNNPYKVGDRSIFIPDFPRFVMNDDDIDVHVLIK
jgi:hypothetical protein